MLTGIHIGIPRNPPRAGANDGGFTPPDAGTLLSWVKTDSSTTSAGYFDSIDENGTWGSDVTAHATQPEDTVHYPDSSLKHVPFFESSGRAYHTAATSNFARLQCNDGDYTIIIKYYLPENHAGVTNYLFGTFNIAAANIGVSLFVQSGGQLRYAVGNGSGGSFAALIGSAVSQTKGWHDCIMKLSGTTLSIACDGETPVTATVSSPVSTAPMNALYFGAEAAGIWSMDGFISEYLVYDSALSTEDESNVLTYLDDRWNGAPGVRVLLDAQLGITLNGSNVSAWADQSVGNDVSQGDSGRQPAYNSSWRNGLAALDGDGSDDHVDRSTYLAGALSQKGAIYQVGEWDSVLASGCVSVDGSTSRWTTMQQASEVALFAGSSNGQSGLTPVASEAYIRRDFVDGNNSEVRVLFDGSTEQTSSTWSANPGTGDMNGMSVLAMSSGGSAWDGSVAKVIVFDHQPLAAVDNAIFDALSSAYDITEP